MAVMSGHCRERLQAHIPNWLLGCSTWVPQRHLIVKSQSPLSRPQLPSSEEVLPQSPKVFCASREDDFNGLQGDSLAYSMIVERKNQVQCLKVLCSLVEQG